LAHRPHSAHAARKHDQKLDWTPWITRYWDLTRDPAIKDYLLSWLEDYGYARRNLWAYGYYITGNEEYAKRVARELFLDEVTTVKRDDAYDGMIGRQMKPWADELTASLPSFKAAEACQLNLRDFQPAEHWPYWVNWGVSVPYTLSKERVDDYLGGAFPWPKDDTFRITSYVYHDGSPKKLWLGIQNMSARPGAVVDLLTNQIDDCVGVSSLGAQNGAEYALLFRLEYRNPAIHSWAWMRESQQKVLTLPHTGIINSIDLGDRTNIHPKDKLPVGQRLALLAARDIHGQDVMAQGPVLEDVELKGDSIIIHFSSMLTV